MSCKIQITVDDELSKEIKKQARHLGLSISSYARLALLKAIPRNKKKSVLDQGIEDLKANRVETISLGKFKKQLHR